jgi:peptide/nickel transport system substrate-binding protein
VPKKYIEKVGDDQYRRQPVGCGPYKFVEFRAGIRVVGEAFAGFWRKEPKIKRIEFYMVESNETRYAQIKTGEMDYVSRMDGLFYEQVKKDPSLRLLTPGSPSNWMMHLTAQWDPKSPWSDVRVRKAASLALDRKTLADIYVPGASPAGDLGLAGDPDNLASSADPYDPAQAKKLMAEAGYGKGFQGGTFYPFAGASWWSMGEQITNYWKAIGISMETVQLGRPDYLARRSSGKMQGGVVVEPLTATTVSGRMAYLFGGGSYSFGSYPEIQVLWNQFNQSIDRKVRQDLIFKIQQIMNDKKMYVYMVGSSTPSAVGKRLKGDPFKLQPLAYWIGPMEDLELND